MLATPNKSAGRRSAHALSPKSKTQMSRPETEENMIVERRIMRGEIAERQTNLVNGRVDLVVPQAGIEMDGA
jgi:hypothetical protein